MILTSTSSAVSSITNFEEIVAPPIPVFAGESFRAEYIFETSIATDILINYTIVYAKNNSTSDKVNSSEWTILYEVDDYLDIMDMNETVPGEFLDEFSISKGVHSLIVEVHSLPNIISGKYNFSISLSAFLLEDIPIKPTHSTGRNFSRIGYITPTPNATANLKPIVATPTIISTVEPTITPSEPTSNNNWLFSMLISIIKGIVAGILFLILLVLSIRRYNAWRYRNDPK